MSHFTTIGETKKADGVDDGFIVRLSSSRFRCCRFFNINQSRHFTRERTLNFVAYIMYETELTLKITHHSLNDREQNWTWIIVNNLAIFSLFIFEATVI